MRDLVDPFGLWVTVIGWVSVSIAALIVYHK